MKNAKKKKKEKEKKHNLPRSATRNFALELLEWEHFSKVFLYDIQIGILEGKAFGVSSPRHS